MVAKFLDHNNIELKQRRQRWQRERQKSNRFIMAKQQLCTSITVCCHSEILLPWQRDETTSPVYCLRSVAWAQPLQLGEKSLPPPPPKKKKIGERSVPNSGLGRRKGAAALSPSPVHRSARFARRFFLCRFHSLFWHFSLQRGPRLQEGEDRMRA